MVTVNAVAQVSTVTPNDFSSPVTHTVHAADGATQNYTVTVTIETQSASITITPSTVSPSISVAGYLTLSLSLVGSVNADQTVSISNSTALQALGVMVISEQRANLNSCILNDNTPTCIFNVKMGVGNQNC